MIQSIRYAPCQIPAEGDADALVTQHHRLAVKGEFERVAAWVNWLAYGVEEMVQPFILRHFSSLSSAC